MVQMARGREQHHHPGKVGQDRGRHHHQGAGAIVQAACGPARRSRSRGGGQDASPTPAIRPYGCCAAHRNAAGQCQNRKIATNRPQPASGRHANFKPGQHQQRRGDRDQQQMLRHMRSEQQFRHRLQQSDTPGAPATLRPATLSLRHGGTVREAMVLNRMAKKNQSRTRSPTSPESGRGLRRCEAYGGGPGPDAPCCQARQETRPPAAQAISATMSKTITALKSAPPSGPARMVAGIAGIGGDAIAQHQLSQPRRSAPRWRQTAGSGNNRAGFRRGADGIDVWLMRAAPTAA